MNIEKLSVKELRELHARIPAVIAERKRQELAEVKAKMAAMAEKQGFTLAEIVGAGAQKRRNGRAVRFRSPSGETWSGLGRRPKWMAGKDPEQFRVA